MVRRFSQRSECGERLKKRRKKEERAGNSILYAFYTNGAFTKKIRSLSVKFWFRNLESQKLLDYLVRL